MSRLGKPVVMLVLLTAMTVALLSSAWRGPYFRIDDETHVRQALEAPWRSWFVPTYLSTYFPVTMFSYRVDHVLYGSYAPRPVDPVVGANMPQPLSSAPAMRLMSGLYHLLAGLLLWQFLRRIGANAGLAAFVALAWTGHPMACESVCWVAERKNVLCALFGFGALLAWTAERRHLWRLPLVAVLYALAGLSKPTALGLLPVFIVLEVLDPPRREFQWREPRRWLGLLGRLAAPALISVGILAAGLYAHKAEIVEPPGGSVWTAIATDAEIFGRYVANTLFPVKLSFFYGVEPVVSPADPRLWLYGLGLLAFLGGLVWAAGSNLRPLAWLGVLWFLGALGPNSNLVAIPFWMQDRYVYLAAPGLLLAVGAAVCGLAQRLQQVKLLPAVGAVALAALAILAAWRSTSFSNSDRLIVEAAQRQPTSAFAQLVAGNVLRDRYNYFVRQAQPLPRGSDEWKQQIKLAGRYAKEAVEHYLAAGQCTDIDHFVDPFTLRVWTAEVLAWLGLFEQAREVLGPLPPPGLQMLPELTDDGRPIVRNRTASFKGYPPRSLAGAWLIRGEASLRQCGVKDIAPERKLALAEQARHEAEESLKYAVLQHEALVLWARATFVMSNHYADKNDMPAALRLYDAAVAKLKEVPPTSLSAANAHMYLENVKAPPPPPR